MSSSQTLSSHPLTAEQISYAVDGTLLVDGISLALAPGRLTGLIGPNGAGKSTLLRLLGGLLSPSTGTVLLSGEAIGRLEPEQIARQVGRVPQSPPAELDFTLLEVVLMGRYAHSGGWQESAADRQIALGALDRTGLAHLAARRYSTLSGGERQRAVIARALAQEPRVLLLDEPTASLDLRHQWEIMEGVRRAVVEQSLTGVAAIHDLGLACRYADQLLLLHRGRVVAAGVPDEVLRPDRLRQVFGVEAEVERHPRDGRLLIHVTGIACDEGEEAAHV